MPQTVRLLTLGIVILSAMLTSCGNDKTEFTKKRASKASVTENHVLVLTATGTAPIHTLTYTFGDKTVEEKSAVLPWKETVNVPADGKRYEWELIAHHGSGDVQLIATLDGSLLTQSEGGGTGDGTVSVSGWVES